MQNNSPIRLDELNLTEVPLPTENERCERVRVPEFLVKAFAFIKENGGRRTEGIFRRNGNNQRVENATVAFYGGDIPDDCTAIDVAILIKRFIKRIQHGLLQGKEARIYEFSIDNQGQMFEKPAAIFTFIKTLPSLNQCTLAYLMYSLKRISDYESENKMSVANLATCISQSLFVNTDFSMTPGENNDYVKHAVGVVNRLVAYMINHYTEILKPPMKLTNGETRKNTLPRGTSGNNIKRSCNAIKYEYPADLEQYQPPTTTPTPSTAFKSTIKYAYPGELPPKPTSASMPNVDRIGERDPKKTGSNTMKYDYSADLPPCPPTTRPPSNPERIGERDLKKTASKKRRNSVTKRLTNLTRLFTGSRRPSVNNDEPADNTLSRNNSSCSELKLKKLGIQRSVSVKAPYLKVPSMDRHQDIQRQSSMTYVSNQNGVDSEAEEAWKPDSGRKIRTPRKDSEGDRLDLATRSDERSCRSKERNVRSDERNVRSDERNIKSDERTTRSDERTARSDERRSRRDHEYQRSDGQYSPKTSGRRLFESQRSMENQLDSHQNMHASRSQLEFDAANQTEIGQKTRENDRARYDEQRHDEQRHDGNRGQNDGHRGQQDVHRGLNDEQAQYGAQTGQYDDQNQLHEALGQNNENYLRNNQISAQNPPPPQLIEAAKAENDKENLLHEFTNAEMKERKKPLIKPRRKTTQLENLKRNQPNTLNSGLKDGRKAIQRRNTLNNRNELSLESGALVPKNTLSKLLKRKKSQVAPHQVNSSVVRQLGADPVLVPLGLHERTSASVNQQAKVSDLIKKFDNTVR
ncbi:unnamed protein product [Bursaphelenchus okinawaensis]|uniref:Rho-GAP domain-containing protein n=1 Tax=Bursaphelenchus okinawaensis TaxID=465554 RepID=A0A811L6V3_9BILA|nr:unnamed protein product [Bursaphelenchus okinawaensis]CAG9116921.1 unnamed protein product [Bursaphelenchus okinawaensis]